MEENPEPAIKVLLLNIFRLELKRSSVEYRGRTVGDVLGQFEADYLDKLPDYLKNPEKTHLNDNILVLLNGVNIRHLQGLDTPLKEGDEMQLSVPIVGG